MERVITVIATNANDKKVFTSSANTLGELKAEMTAQGIDYNGMDFMEGISHTTMIDDAAQLPSNIMYKGNITNNLVFMLSTTNKRIASGAYYDRNTCYDKVKEYNLQDIIKSKYGRNFTQVDTAALNTEIIQVESKNEVPKTRKELYTYIKDNNLGEAFKGEHLNYTNLDTETLYQYVKKFSKKCVKTDVSNKKSATIKKNTVKSPYSNKELDNIIKGLKK